MNATRNYRLVDIILLYQLGFHGLECPKETSSLMLCSILVCVGYGGLIFRKKCFLLARMLKKVLFIPGFSKIARTDSI